MAPVFIDDTGPDNPAGLPADEVKKLVAGGPLAKLRWLYPYDGTVFPRDTLAPTLMWEGDPATEVVYVHIRSQAFEYKAILRPMVGSGKVWLNNPMQPQLRLPQEIWDTAGQKTLGKADPFRIELSTRVNGVVAGPIVLHFNIAPAAVKGSIYYTTYLSNLLGASVSAGSFGTMLRIPPRGTAELVLSGGALGSNTCGGCHSVAANGSHLLGQTINLSAAPEEMAQAWSYRLNPNGGALTNPVLASPYAPFAALYPDGSKYLTGSLTGDPAAQGLGTPLVLGMYAAFSSYNKAIPVDATLYDTATLQVIPDTGIPPGALMPMFSPNGTRLVFNDVAINRAHGLAMMDYDTTRNKASRYRVLTREDPPTGAAPTVFAPGWRPAWPSFTPDNRAVVFVRTDSADFAGWASATASVMADNTTNRQSTSNTYKSQLKSSDLHIVDVASGKVTVLAKAMGFNTPGDFSSGRTYLPFGDNDWHHNYYPTVSPVAAGGYFWVFFDSFRNYGNLGLGRQLWGTAIDIRPDGSYTTDPSHPPFYVEGQEFGADNHRAFAALELCKPDGDACTTGIDCCAGFCSIPNVAPGATGDPRGSCSPPPAEGCARSDERCQSDADCCPAQGTEPTNVCIAGFCAFVPLL